MVALPRANVPQLRGGPVLRWGILAPGGIATHWADSVARHTDQRIVAVASRSLPRAKRFAELHGIDSAYGSYSQLVENPDVDIVYIAAPNSLHVELALLAIGAGKHVLVEKPLATSVAEASRIVRAAEQAGVFAGEAMWSRFLPQASVVAELLRRGALGQVRLVTADLGVRMAYDPASRAFDPALGGGALLDLGVYAAWFAHAALGAPSGVSASGILAPTGVDAQAALVLDYEGRASATLAASFAVTSARNATISGTDARLEYTGSFKDPSSLRVVDGATVTEWTDDSGITISQGLCYQAAAVAHHVAQGRRESPEHDLADSLAILAVLDEARLQILGQSSLVP